MRLVLIAAVLLLGNSALASPPGTIANLQSIPIFFTCLAQDEQLYAQYVEKAQSEAAKATAALPRDSGEEAWYRDQQVRLKAMVRESAWSTCVRSKAWISKELCSAVVTESMRPGMDVRRVFSEHQEQLKQLKPMYDYFEAAFPRGGEPRANAPRCPD